MPSLVVLLNFESKERKMKRSNGSITLNEFRQNEARMKIITMIVTAFLVTVLIILPAAKALSFAYVTYNKCVHLNETLPMIISDAKL